MLEQKILSTKEEALGIGKIKNIDLNKITTLILVDIKTPERLGKFSESNRYTCIKSNNRFAFSLFIKRRAHRSWNSNKS